ncbi:MAG: DMT family transporter [Treponema sp.]|nr:DMT family transporter [Treponema sp.]
MSAPEKNRRVLASIGLVLTAAIWGFAFVIVKDSLDYIGPIWMMAFRFTIAAAALALAFCKKLKSLGRRLVGRGAFTGFFLFAAYAVQTIGCKYTTAGKNAFLTTLYVILIPFFAWPVFHKKPRAVALLAALMSLCGIGMLALKKEDGFLSMNVGDALTLACGVFFALHIVFTSWCNRDDDPILITILQFFFAALFSWILAPLYDGAIPVAQFSNARVVCSVLYLGIFSTLVAFVLQNVCLKYMESSLASLFLSLESVFGVLFGAMFLRERLSPIMIFGCVLIFAAITISNLSDQN